MHLTKHNDSELTVSKCMIDSALQSTKPCLETVAMYDFLQRRALLRAVQLRVRKPLGYKDSVGT